MNPQTLKFNFNTNNFDKYEYEIMKTIITLDNMKETSTNTTKRIKNELNK